MEITNMCVFVTITDTKLQSALISMKKPI